MLEGLDSETAELLERIMSDTDACVQTFFRIKDMAGQIVPFRYNRAQRLYKERSTQFDYVLKPRKVGISSRRFARDIWTCATQKYQHRIVLAQSDEDVSKIYETKVHPIINNSLIPLNAKIKGDHVFFPETDSRYYIGTAGAKRFGRGSDITGYHFTEYAHWENPDVVAGVEEGLVDGSDGLLETTANGNNFAKIDWDRAKKKLNRYRAIFLPWFVHEPYTADPSSLGPISEDERRLMEAFGLNPGQIAWKRAKIASMRDPALFPQEYPETPEQAFLKSDRPVFDLISIARMKNYATEPKRRGTLWQNNKRIELQPNNDGQLKIWKEPEPGHVYAIGGDVAEGIEGGAYSAGFVLDLGDSEQVAEWHGHIAPDLFGEALHDLSRWYNQALLIPEAWPGPGGTTAAILERAGARLWADENGKYWETTTRSKMSMILSLAAAVREHQITLRSQELIDEMTSYVYDEKGHMVPSIGSFSDRIIAAALAWYVTREMAGRVDYYRVKRIGGTLGGGASVPKFQGPRLGVRNDE